jgi:serine/threonine protein kinase
MGSLRVQKARGEHHPRDPLPGIVINGKFRVGPLLARGGMGRVYRAEQVPLGRPVALKVLRSHLPDETPSDPNFQKRFFLEASILSRLQHPNIVTLYDYGRIEGLVPEQYFMAMEFLAGETLSARIRSRGAVPVAESMGIFRQIARGLRDAHKHGVVHRDLKPENMMLVPCDDGGDIVKLVDFGIGKMVGGDFEELTQEGVFVGSPKYMAPEQILSDSKIDERTDVYSFGVIMFECLSGKLPFDGDTSVKMMMAHCGCPVPSIAARNPAVRVPPILEDLVRHALEKEPANRPAGMDALMSELRACEQAITGAYARATLYAGRPTAIAPPDAVGGSVPPSSYDAHSMTPEVASIKPLASATSRPPPPSRPGPRVWHLLGMLVGLAAASGGTAAMFMVPHRGFHAQIRETPASPPIAAADPTVLLLFELLPPVSEASVQRDAASNASPVPSVSASGAVDPPRPTPRGATSTQRPAARPPPSPSPPSLPTSAPEIKTTR